MTRRITDDQRGQVVTLIQAGRGRNQIARETGLSQGAVSAIAKREGLSIVPAGVTGQQLKQLLDGARLYDRERRLKMYSRAMEVAETMLADPSLTPRGLQAVVLAQAVADDKVKVLLGEQTAQPAAQFNAYFLFPSNSRGPAPTDAPAWLDEAIEVLPAPLPADERTGQ